MKKLLTSLLLLVLIAIAIYVYQAKNQAADRPIVTPVSYQDLPNWGKLQTLKISFNVFRKSCQVLVKKDPKKLLNTDLVNLTVEDMLPACKRALSMHKPNAKQVEDYFQTWFQPLEVRQGDHSPEGLFTGYYAPLLHGSLEKTNKYNIPIYSLPKSLIRVDLSKFDPESCKKTLVGRIKDHEFLPYHDRQAINNGALKDVPVLAWVDSRVDRQFLEIEGSGIIQLNNGKRMYVGYAGQNGLPYTALAGILIRQGLMTRDNASMQAIRSYFKDHPDKIDEYLHQNQSFVFFHKLKQNAALGAQGIPITAGYSLAVDRNYVPLGLPIWLSTTYQDKTNDDPSSLNRLMIAQDTGGAIKGPIRGDVYWGPGDKAAYRAGHMRNPGRWWLLVPKDSLASKQS